MRICDLLSSASEPERLSLATTAMEDDDDEEDEESTGETKSVVDFNPDKPFACGVCASSFASKSNLKVHLGTVHAKSRPYQCDDCRRNFGTKSSLTRHQRIVHDNQRPHSCSICHKHFASRSCVKRHEKVHDSYAQYMMAAAHDKRAPATAIPPMSLMQS